jgi:hypothetical protein
LKILIILFSMGWFLHRVVAFPLENPNRNASVGARTTPW